MLRERLFLHREPPYMRPYPPANAVRRNAMVIGDEIERPFKAFGRFHTSKSRFRAEVKARGYDEIGNEHGEMTRREPLPEIDVRDTLAEVGNSLGGFDD